MCTHLRTHLLTDWHFRLSRISGDHCNKNTWFKHKHISECLYLLPPRVLGVTPSAPSAAHAGLSVVTGVDPGDPGPYDAVVCDPGQPNCPGASSGTSTAGELYIHIMQWVMSFSLLVGFCQLIIFLFYSFFNHSSLILTSKNNNNVVPKNFTI